MPWRVSVHITKGIQSVLKRVSSLCTFRVEKGGWLISVSFEIGLISSPICNVLLSETLLLYLSCSWETVAVSCSRMSFLNQTSRSKKKSCVKLPSKSYSDFNMSGDKCQSHTLPSIPFSYYHYHRLYSDMH